VRELVIRRDRTVLPPELAFGTLERKVVRHVVAEAEGIDDLRFPLVEGAALIRRFLRRRLESSEAALAESIRRQRRFYERVLESGRALTKRDYRRAFGAEEDDEVFQQILFWDLWAPAEAVDVKMIRDEMQRLDRIHVEPSGKRALLVNILTDEPTLIFTQFAATARDLGRFLKCGIATSRDGAGALHAFRIGRTNLLVATDLASEGLNLQRAAVIVHYDLPWNPVKLDQRNGRAHRIGQTRDKVRAIYFIPDDRGIMSVIARKNRERRATLRTTANCQRSTATLRPRIAGTAAVVKLVEAGYDVPEWLERRHCAGLERLLRGSREI
jgi:superfamily II DNA or RNA helicase